MELEQLGQLERDMMEVKKELGDMAAQLALMNPKLDRIDRGLYGDPANDYLGVIAQQKATQQQLDAMRVQYDAAIKALEAKNVEQDLALKTKKNVYLQVLDWVKWAGLIFLVLRGIFGLDTLLGGKFMP